MAQQTNIKVVIELLCNLCKKLGFSKVTPEMFRQAKFNNPEATKPFWILLFEMLHCAVYRKFEFHTKKIDYIVPCVKTIFYDLGYRSQDFLELGSSPLEGSRELLIAFGWLIGKFEIMDQLVNNAERVCFDLLLGKGAEYDKELRNPATDFVNLNDSLDHILVSYNRSNMEWKSLRQLCRGLVKRAVNSDFKMETDDVSLQMFLKNASFLEVVAIFGSKTDQDRIMLTLEKENMLLNAYAKWLKNEELFWKWMSSVVEEKQSDIKQKGRKCLDRKVDEGITEFNHAQNENEWDGTNIREISDAISKLIHIVLKTKWANIDSEKRNVLPCDKKKSSINCKEIQRTIDELQFLISETEQKLASLEEMVKKTLTIENDDRMEDIIHLPFPRR